MRRAMILIVSVLTIVTMAVSPAFAGDWDGDGWDEDYGFWVLVPVFVEYDHYCDWDDCDWDDHDWDDDDHDWYYDRDHDDWYNHEWEGPVHLID